MESMSADNGVYILHTKGPEFRVAYHQAIDNIYGNFNDDTGHWDGDPYKIVEYFEKAPVFLDINSAWDYAEKLAENYDYLEYGVCQINDFNDFDFGSLNNGDVALSV
jgi:hypothetical protein